MLVMEGCYSFEPFARQDPGVQLPGADEEILVSVDGGPDIEVKPHHSIEIREPSTLVYGEGERILRTGGSWKYFCGTFRPVARNAAGDVLVPVSWERNERVQQSEFLLEDGSRIRMKDPDCVMVDSSGGAGLWCVGVMKEGTGSRPFSGRIPFDRISSVEVRTFSLIKSTALALGVVGVAAVVVEVGKHLPGHMGNLALGQP